MFKDPVIKWLETLLKAMFSLVDLALQPALANMCPDPRTWPGLFLRIHLFELMLLPINHMFPEEEWAKVDSYKSSQIFYYVQRQIASEKY